MSKFNKITTFWFNGQEYLSQNNKFTILDLLNYFDYNTSLLVVEYNNFISLKKNWNKIIVRNDDKIEVLTIVGGG
jgi:thiamine biosynthesis protein ThiS